MAFISLEERYRIVAEELTMFLHDSEVRARTDERKTLLDELEKCCCDDTMASALGGQTQESVTDFIARKRKEPMGVVPKKPVVPSGPKNIKCFWSNACPGHRPGEYLCGDDPEHYDQ